MIFRFLAMALAIALAVPVAALSQKETDDLVRFVDERQRNRGDFAGLCYMESREKDKTDVVNELVYYRRSEGQRFLILFTKPKSEAGKGYLRVEKNLWYYDPGTGKWERRTERERIGGTDTRREDLDESRLAQEYTAKWECDEKLGAHDAHRILLEVKPDVDVAYPRVRLWVDASSGNLLKRQDMALSGRLMRTMYLPRWKKVYSESKGMDVWYAQELRLYDEVEKANSTLILVKQVDLHPLDANMFTKAWLESKSR
ncbi:MAG TPA: outer membrane lipoprotein-sorting protein [Anaeromyxobacteraceae bacterium]|nr:outer membrane lipoprotein-sorting protein [Anaeromyxobacteraceae bacterium]